jgi:hypothetical protein
MKIIWVIYNEIKNVNNENPGIMFQFNLIEKSQKPWHLNALVFR